MNTPDDREPRPAAPQTPPSGQAWLPPRLRDKIDEGGGGGEEWKPQKSSPAGLIITLVVVVAAVGGIWYFVRASQEKARAEAARVAAVAQAAAVADSLAKVRMVDSLAAIAHADSMAFAALPKWKQRQILTEKAKAAATTTRAAATTPPAGASATAGAKPAPGAGSSAAASAPPKEPAESGPFTIDAGEYLDESRAKEVGDGIAAKSGLSARVVTVGDTYHIMLGTFPTRGAATKKADDLLGQGLVRQGAVVPAPKSK